MNFHRTFLMIILIFTLFSILNAQVGRQTGVIRGIVVDREDNPIPGATVTASGPALMGTITDITRADGSYRLPSLPPGSYTVTAELEGFKPTKRGDVIVRVGMVVTINFKIELATLKEEVTVVATSPTVDVQSSKISYVVTAEQMNKLPLNRNFFAILNTVPGVSQQIGPYEGSIYGSTSRPNSGTVINWELDGVNANDAAWGGIFATPQFDAMEEIEITAGGLPAQVGNTGGGFVNIVTKSGGNEFHGSAQVFYNNHSLTDILITDEQLTAMSIGKPTSPIFSWDASGTLGGPIVKDRIWFFTDLGFLSSSRYGLFVPTTIEGKKYEPYNLPQTYWRGMAKISTKLSKSLRFFVMFHGELENVDVFEQALTRATYAATFAMKNNYRIPITGNLTWLLGSNTFVDFRLGYVSRWYPITTREEYDANMGIRDGYTGYLWNGVTTWQSKIFHQTSQVAARITHFKDDFLGGNHELGAGVEYYWGRETYGYERTNPLTWWYYNGNPYYYRGYYGLNGPHPVFGDGRVQFSNCGANPHDSEKYEDVNRWGAYVQDSFSIKNRLVINAGLRLDYFSGLVGKASTTGTTGLSYEIGKTFEPLIGFNPYGPFEMAPIKDIVVFTTLSPRIGLSYDLFGNGKSAIKLAYSRYNEQMTINQFYAASPAVLANYYFNWFDLNRNGQLDLPGVDRYDPRDGLGQFTQPNRNYLISAVDPNLKSPYHDEILASINHELFPNFAVRLQYIYKRGSKLPGYALYDRDTKRFWYKYEDAPDWWVPFTTIAPAIGAYPAQKVTVYFRTQNSPWNRQFTLQTGIRESRDRYHGIELSFDKRYSHGWNLGGSLVLSQYKSLTAGSSPNDFVNGFGLSGRPLDIKLFGSLELPFGFVSSFFYRHQSGAPFQRTVTVAPPADWAQAHNTLQLSQSVNVEEGGSRRGPSYDNIDVRLEKEFRILSGRLGLFMDVYNLSGNQYINIGQNPGGTWRPVGENTDVGTFTPSYDYSRVTSVSGTRIYKFSIRLSF